MRARVGLGVGLLLFLVSPTACMETRFDEETGTIRAIYGRAPCLAYQVALGDPRIQIAAALPWLSYATPLADLRYARRLARIYLPRSYGQLVGSIDLIVLQDIDSAIFTPQVLEWFRRSVVTDGLGMVMGGGSQGFGGNPPFTSWGDSSLEPIIPVECFHGERLPKSYLVRLEVVDQENELGGSLPWERAPPYYPPNYVEAKEGCRLIVVSRDEKRTPIYFFWDVGAGRFLGVQSMNGGFSLGFDRWEYYPDTVLNALYFAVGFPLPEDLAVVHELRRGWQQIRIQRDILRSLLDYADRFGANTRRIEEELSAVEVTKAGSDQLYLGQRYGESLETLRTAISALGELQRKAMLLKDRALLWIYLVEWLTVLGTLLLCGFLLWGLMVKRRLYREAGATRFK